MYLLLLIRIFYLKAASFFIAEMTECTACSVKICLCMCCIHEPHECTHAMDLAGMLLNNLYTCNLDPL